MFSGWLERRGKNRRYFVDYKVMVFMLCLNYYPLTTNALSLFVVNLPYWELGPTCSPSYQIFLLCLHFLQLIFLIACLSPLFSTYILSMGFRGCEQAFFFTQLYIFLLWCYLLLTSWCIPNFYFQLFWGAVSQALSRYSSIFSKSLLLSPSCDFHFDERHLCPSNCWDRNLNIRLLPLIFHRFNYSL